MQLTFVIAVFDIDALDHAHSPICDTRPKGTPPKVVPFESHNVGDSKNRSRSLAERQTGQKTRSRFKRSDCRYILETTSLYPP
jgi:hypothetical protein